MTQIPKVTAHFESSLAAKITASASTCDIVSVLDKAGNSISGYVGVTIDEGTATEEEAIGTISGSTLTFALRGLDPQDPTLAVTALKFQHRRGASIKITDAPVLAIIRLILNGELALPNKLIYASNLTFLDDKELIPKKYADDLAIAGSPKSSTTINGIGKTSTAPADPLNPIFVGDNDGRVPTQAENDAMVGTSGSPVSSSNKLVDNSDTQGSGKILRSSNVETLFGGDGSDGALSISSDVTTIDLGGLKFVEKNYSSISITGTGALAFTNPHTNGSTIILKSQGNVTITTSATRAIDLRALGSAGGSGGVGVTNNSTANPGTVGAAPSVIFSYLVDAITGAAAPTNQVGSQSANAAGGSFTITLFNKTITNLARLFKTMALMSAPAGGGSGGGSAGSGTGSTSGNGGAGGTGAGSMYLECAGALNFTGTIDASGTNGGDALASSGTVNAGGSAGGGGGAGGVILILYKTLTANSGTITVNGGAGGAGQIAIAGAVGAGNSGGGNGGAGGANIFYSGGAGGGAGYDSTHHPTAATAGGNGGGAAGTPGSSANDQGTFGVNNTKGAGGGGGGGAKGFSLVSSL